MSSETVIAPRTIARRTRTGVIFGLTWSATAAVLTGMVALFLMLTGTLPTAAGLVIAGLAIPAGAIRLGGRPLVEWVPIAGVYVYRKATNNTCFTKDLNPPQVAASLNLPGDAARLRLVLDEAGVAYIHDPHTRHLTATLRVNHGGTVLLDATRQMELDHGFGKLLDGIARFDENIARIQIIERTLPSGGGLLTNYHANKFGPLIDTHLAEVYETLVAKQGESLRHESLIAITLDLGGATARIRDMGGGLTGAIALAREVMQTLQGSVQEAGLAAGGWLTEPDLALLIRSVYDPAAIPALSSAAIGRRATTAGPMGASETWNAIQTDSAHHQVLQVTEWPRTPLGPMSMWPIILTPGVQRTVSLILRPIPVAKSRREARTSVSDSQIERTRRARRRGWDDPEDAAEVDQAQKRLREVTLLGSREFQFIGLVAVTAPGIDALRKEVRTVLTHAQQADLELRPLVAQQAQHLPTATLPLGRGL